MPLAHILAPQIARKAAELDAVLNPGGQSPQGGYLAANPLSGGGGHNSREPLRSLAPQGDPARPPANQARVDQLVRDVPGGVGSAVGAAMQPEPARQGGYLTIGNKKKPAKDVTEYDPRTVAGSYWQALGSLPPGWEQFRAAAGRAAIRGEQHTGPEAKLIPTAPSAPPVQVIPPGGRHKNLILLPDGEPVAQTESGVQLDNRGRKLGYLDQEYGTGVRTLDRRPSDLNLDQTAGNIIRDPFARKQLDYVYGEHVKAMESNRDDRGMPTDKLPDGYFQALGEERGKPYTKDERESVMAGIKKLREVQKLEATDTGGGIPIAST